MIISDPVHTAVWLDRGAGAPVVVVAVQLSGVAPLAGIYLAPVLVEGAAKTSPPHTIISLPDQIAVCPLRAEGAPVVVVMVQAPGVGR